MQAHKTSIVKLTQKFCNKDKYTIEDFFRLYEYVNAEKGFDKFGALNPIGSWMIRAVLDAIIVDEFDAEPQINPSYLGEIFYGVKSKNERLNSFLSSFNKSKQDWFKLHKQYIGIECGELNK